MIIFVWLFKGESIKKVYIITEGRGSFVDSEQALITPN